MERVWNQKKNCCGCTACEHTCPTHAIEMKREEEGFLYPQIRADLCVDCGACQNVCPILHSEELKADSIPRVYGAKHRDEAVLMESTSGGAFTALSDLVLNRLGVVYGVSFRQDWDNSFQMGKKTDATDLEKSTELECSPLYVSHFRAETGEERNRFRFSKYVQSDLKSVFIQVEEDLRWGRLVLFTGTPCQNAGLKSFCTRKGGKVPERLILCDVVCHSVPSPQIWQEYVDTLEWESGRKRSVFPGDESEQGQSVSLEDEFGQDPPIPLVRAQFRTKDTPWSRQSKSFRFRRLGEPGVRTDDRYHRLLFEFQTVARPSCYSCPFCELRRTSDLTIADYWGMEKYLPQFTDGRGVSLILTNTPKGERMFEQMKDVMDWVERPLEECLTEQPRLRGPLAEPSGREAFWKAWKKGEISFETLRLQEIRKTQR